MYDIEGNHYGLNIGVIMIVVSLFFWIAGKAAKDDGESTVCKIAAVIIFIFGILLISTFG